jgi:hypothetical protein
MCPLLAEVRRGSSVTRLYASLLAKAVLDDDEVLEREYGEQFAELGIVPDGEPAA